MTSQAFAPTAAFLYDTAGMLRSWLADLAVEQLEDLGGVVPLYVPWLPLLPFPRRRPRPAGATPPSSCRGRCTRRTATPGCSPTSGRVMTAWLDAFAARAGADWTSPTAAFMLRRLAGPGRPAGPAGRRPDPVAVRRHRLPRPLGADHGAGRRGARPRRRAYADLAERAAERFRAEYVTPNGRLAYPAQTAYALALEFDLLLPGAAGARR